jgi:hypothetical protein
LEDTYMALVHRHENEQTASAPDEAPEASFGGAA